MGKKDYINEVVRVTIPQAALELIERFDRNSEAYRSGHYNETQLRREFIDPLFTELGWDVENRHGYAEAYKDVIHEDAIKIGGATKAPDYCFRIGGTRKFFVEAKKPSVKIKDDMSAAFQLRRYAWSAKLPLSVLTNFDEFAVYDCRIKPDKDDKPSAARILYLRRNDYATRWEEITSAFSREAVLKGSFDSYAESIKGKKGTAEVDNAFLAEIDSWRSALAHNIALRNHNLGQRELNFAVQRTIDRLIFLRICEDRGIEVYGGLQSLLNGEQVYERLCKLFRDADDRYNSGLFHFRQEKGRNEPPDDLTLSLCLDDRLMKAIIRRLYYPDSPYEFSVISADILGQIYEQFLGRVIRLTPSHRAVVEDKPEVKKAGGVYYTPTYVVDYIVQHTVANLVEGRTPKQVAKLRILDPACGSGSFLIGAYQHLLDWHRDWYIADGVEKHKKELYQGIGGDWRLATAERKRILLNSIYGVDIDPQAVEVTKLSLLLKVLEGETERTLAVQLQFFHKRALPDLESNIKCGNSLIGPDFYDNRQMSLLDDDERYRVNAFDWRVEFPDISSGKNAGFDAVIGNPPYVFGRDWRGLGISDGEKKYLGSAYHTSPYQMDMFSIFMEKASQLCCLSGRVGQIVPNVWLTNTYSSSTRAFILDHANDLCVTVPPADVFPGLTVDTVIYTFQKAAKPAETIEIRAMRDGTTITIAVHDTDEYLDGQRPISTALDRTAAHFIMRLKRSHPELRRFAEVTRGVHSYRTGGYGQTAFGLGHQTIRDVRERPYHSDHMKPGYRPFVYGRDLSRFAPVQPTEFVRYGPWLAEPRRPEFFQSDRVYSRKILGDRLVVTVETGESVADQQVYITLPTAEIPSARYLAAFLGVGSSLSSFERSMMK